MAAGSLPPGLSLNATTGVIGGTPTSAAGSPYSFSVTVRDNSGTTSPAQSLSIAIAPGVTVTTTSLSNGSVGAAYSATLTASGGTAPYGNWLVAAGSPPPGLEPERDNGV